LFMGGNLYEIVGRLWLEKYFHQIQEQYAFIEHCIKSLGHSRVRPLTPFVSLT